MLGLEDDLPFSLWEDVLRAVRTSPDHLTARAENLVQGGDPAKIFEFVRDAILTVPPNLSGFKGSVDGTRSGVRSVLRTGAGTPREKVELLAELLGRAGYATSVVQGTPDRGLDMRRAVLRDATPAFDPDVDQQRQKEWMEALGLPDVPVLPRLDPDGATTRQVATSVSGIRLESAEFDWAPDGLPLIEVSTQDGLVMANPVSPMLGWGDPGAGNLIPAVAATATPTVGIALRVAQSSDPSVMFTVAEGSWSVDQLTGRRVVARFVPEGDPEIALFVPPRSVSVLTSLLVIDGPDVDLEADPSLLVVGDTVGLGG
ncbi:MAG: hypothetical protein OEM32_09880, partial [Acidimicrobiia bacterium]|nr:hypothetical protein [Acidimicrobiia bacterium]